LELPIPEWFIKGLTVFTTAVGIIAIALTIPKYLQYLASYTPILLQDWLFDVLKAFAVLLSVFGLIYSYNRPMIVVSPIDQPIILVRGGVESPYTGSSNVITVYLKRQGWHDIRLRRIRLLCPRELEVSERPTLIGRVRTGVPHIMSMSEGPNTDVYSYGFVEGEKETGLLSYDRLVGVRFGIVRKGRLREPGRRFSTKFIDVVVSYRFLWFEVAVPTERVQVFYD
jgi:hypothetical protein